MRKFLSILLFFSGFGVMAQDSLKTQLELVWSIPIDETNVWDNDDAGNIYLFRNQAIVKLDSNGRQLLTQSTKSIGQIAKIDATNWMKIALFSEEQQQVCYLDNALGLLPDCIELGELGISLAQNFSVSAQTDRIWVYDQLNSELQLVTLRTSQRQIVQNLSGTLDMGSIREMIEYNNMLFLLDQKGKVAVFDNFGSLYDAYNITAQSVFPLDKLFFFVQDNKLFYQTIDRPVFVMSLPVEGTIQHFSTVGNRLLISTENTFYSFRVLNL